MAVALTENQLSQIEASLCRAKRRMEWWAPEDKREAQAIGRMCAAALDERDHLSVADQPSLHITQDDIAKLCVVNAGRLCEFLDGHPTGNTNWVRQGYRVLCTALSGSRDLRMLQGDALKIARRILSFFFPDPVGEAGNHDGHPGWFFSDRFRQSAHPQTEAEAQAEIRRLKWEVSENGATARIIRVSSHLRFPQVDDQIEGLTDSGTQSMECLAAGIKIVYLYPTTPNGRNPRAAAKSADQFSKLAHEKFKEKAPAAFDRLLLRAMSPESVGAVEGVERRVGEYFSPILRWTMYELNGEATCLLVSRKSRQHFCAFEPDDGEVADFKKWVLAFVDSDQASVDGSSNGFNASSMAQSAHR